tara:strand:+ start:423 stop:698 length:276 start_codon:yes stop_codon:yes gene_type:complete
MSNWYDPDHLSDGAVRDNVGHQENDNWDCEIELSCHKKENDGRVNTIFMRYLREKYGQNVADRALKRAQKRDQRSIHSTPQTETRMISGVF